MEKANIGNVKSTTNKWWWMIAVIALFWIGGTLANPVGNNTGKSNSVNQSIENRTAVKLMDFSGMSFEDITSWCTSSKIKCKRQEEYSDTVEKGTFIKQSSPANSTLYEGETIYVVYSLGTEPSMEYKNALKKAESYSNILHMSKRGLYEQLISEYGENFPADAAQYAIDNIVVDWNRNALEKAKSYQNNLSMSKNRIFEQLVSEHGEKFTESEAKYAIDNL